MSEKREFDRHSGSNKTGVKAIDKRDGGGAHNWGSVRDEAELAIEETHGAKKTNEAQDEEPKQAENATAGAEMTLQEYLQKEEAKRLHPQFNTRQPEDADVKN